MKIKHNELEILKDTPFVNCKLGREPYAKILTEIVEIYSEGFVLAINNEWGTGKTTFVKMWEQDLINKGFQTIYFNAWENDFDSNPLVALISELKPLIHGKVDKEKVFKSVIEKGAILAKNTFPALAKSLLKKYIVNVDDISADLIENITKSAAEIFEEEIKDYASKKKTIVEFRNELEKFIKKIDKGKPLIFIIDELDRCRPNYAVELLEQMKHLFTVSGIVFVLSIDKKHLASSVKGVYGSEQINTDEYLRRFIDLEYSIPKPSNKIFCKYLFDYYSLGEFFYSIERSNIDEFQNDGENLLLIAEILFNETNATLRQQEKIFGQTRLILNLFKPNQYSFSSLLFVLIYLKTIRNEFYQKIENNSLTLQELSNEFAGIMPSEFKNLSDLNLHYIEALLLQFYNNNKEYQDKVKLIEIDGEGNKTSPIKSKLKGYENSKDLVLSLDYINKNRYSDIKLNFLLKKINLTDPIIIQ